MKNTWVVGFISLLAANIALPAAPALNPRLSFTNRALIRMDMAPRVSTHRPVTRRGTSLAVPLDLGDLVLDKYKVMETSGREWKTTANALEISGGKTNLITRPNQQYILRPEKVVAQETLSADKNLFPGLMVLNRKTSPRGNSEALQAQLFLRPRQVPLPWDDDRRAYSTELVVGLDLVEGEGVIPLNPPIHVQFFPKSASVTPTSLVISNTGKSGYRIASIECDQTSEAASVSALSDMGDVDYPVPLIARLGLLAIRPSSSTIYGFGLGTATLTIERLAENGATYSPSEPLTIHLTTTQGELQPSATLEIPSGQSSATLGIRSAGLGKATITVSGGGREARDILVFVFPLGYLLAAILGGAAGGWSRVLRKNVRPGKKRRRSIMEGVLAGGITVAAITAGLVIGQFPLPAMGTELGAFVVAAISGYIGIPILDQLVEKVFPGQGRRTSNDPPN